MLNGQVTVFGVKEREVPKNGEALIEGPGRKRARKASAPNSLTRTLRSQERAEGKKAGETQSLKGRNGKSQKKTKAKAPGRLELVVTGNGEGELPGFAKENKLLNDGLDQSPKRPSHGGTQPE